MKPAKLSFLDLALIIEGIYYGTEDVDICEIEDLLEYLHDNGHMAAVLNTFEKWKTAILAKER
ncbi:TPA: 6-phosphofructokinase [Enterococcus faecalis]|uniref:6-phosphofructokinase n=1 Tax=Enterococcus faecalis TaxID=1351 RepID=UPI001EE4A3B2|nr:6-phosphofructokinase [Enterococcus faecalis]UKU98445.1 6-phosphofructokinase [Enterococcus faecalis]UKV01165.1 6-phosphofructokinase [Enterococcus faecalis]HAP2860068.1 6-phosphofructokinase [Enterococcus faecalis]HCD5575231.1 6-phosphofructokinase [Enterococcus faecalis]HCR3172342.1 6-phosphofructokinase [Enterococcus faecalis]